MSEHGQTLEPCPLCASQAAEFYRDRRRDYYQCHLCQLVFVPRRWWLSRAEERRHYDFHENNPLDIRYRTFLSRLATPLIARLTPGSRGLDFGCGPGPTLSVMLTEAGFPTRNYDPFYVPDESVWNETYDFITASEVFEHLQNPRDELDRLWSHLQPGGTLAVMTKRYRDVDAFANWHYKNDPTHIVFFRDTTFTWLSNLWSARLEILGPDVILLVK